MPHWTLYIAIGIWIIITYWVIVDSGKLQNISSSVKEKASSKIDSVFDWSSDPDFDSDSN